MAEEKTEPAEQLLNGFWPLLAKAPKPLLYGALAFIAICIGLGLMRWIGGEWPWEGRVLPTTEASRQPQPTQAIPAVTPAPSTTASVEAQKPKGATQRPKQKNTPTTVPNTESPTTQPPVVQNNAGGINIAQNSGLIQNPTVINNGLPDRSLNESQKTAIKTYLATTPEGQYLEVYSNNESESVRFAKEVTNLFVDANRAKKDSYLIDLEGGQPPGIYLIVHSQDDIRASLVIEMAKAFASDGIPVTAVLARSYIKPGNIRMYR